jgi:hypothetical protein
MDEPGASDEIEDDDDFTIRIESDGEVTLILGSTSGETFVRRLRPARALPENVDQGPAAEDATRMAAAVWGLPDLVFLAKVVALGSRRTRSGRRDHHGWGRSCRRSSQGPDSALR